MFRHVFIVVLRYPHSRTIRFSTFPKKQTRFEFYYKLQFNLQLVIHLCYQESDVPFYGNKYTVLHLVAQNNFEEAVENFLVCPPKRNHLHFWTYYKRSTARITL